MTNNWLNCTIFIDMRSGNFIKILIIPLIILIACQSNSPPVEEEEKLPVENVVEEEVISEEDELVITEELYNKTFDEIEQTINELDAIVQRGDLRAWLGYLTQEYIDQKSDPQYLAQLSESFKSKVLKLKNIQDYFELVFVPSRIKMKTKLERIEFIDSTHVKAITIIQDTPALLYYLIYEDGIWKLGIW